MASDFTTLMAQSIAQARPQPAPAPARPTVIPGQFGAGNYKSRKTDVKVGVELEPLMNFLGMQTPAQKRESAFRLQEQIDNMSPEQYENYRNDPGEHASKLAILGEHYGLPVETVTDVSGNERKVIIKTAYGGIKGASEPEILARGRGPGTPAENLVEARKDIARTPQDMSEYDKKRLAILGAEVAQRNDLHKLDIELRMLQKKAVISGDSAAVAVAEKQQAMYEAQAENYKLQNKLFLQELEGKYVPPEDRGLLNSGNNNFIEELTKTMSIPAWQLGRELAPKEAVDLLSKGAGLVKNNIAFNYELLHNNDGASLSIGMWREHFDALLNKARVATRTEKERAYYKKHKEFTRNTQPKVDAADRGLNIFYDLLETGKPTNKLLYRDYAVAMFEIGYSPDRIQLSLESLVNENFTVDDITDVMGTLSRGIISKGLSMYPDVTGEEEELVGEGTPEYLTQPPSESSIQEPPPRESKRGGLLNVDVEAFEEDVRRSLDATIKEAVNDILEQYRRSSDPEAIEKAKKRVQSIRGR